MGQWGREEGATAGPQLQAPTTYSVQYSPAVWAPTPPPGTTSHTWGRLGVRLPSLQSAPLAWQAGGGCSQLPQGSWISEQRVLVQPSGS